jgi:SAM-dependent methyltransferase
MFEAEAIRLREILLAQRDVSPLLNLGSSTGAFRTLAKPHIERELFAPLRAAGVAVIHSDCKPGEGVDVAGDLLDPELIARFKAMGFRCVLISNVLEHVRDRAAVTAACEKIAGPGGLVLATVPSSYPFHADPIDTGFRPTPEVLAAAFTGSSAALTDEVVGRTYAEDLKARGVPAWKAALQTLAWILAAPVRPKSVLSRVHRWLWFSRPYRVAVALVRVGTDPAAG